MKIMLVTPYMNPTPTRWIPIGLGYLASSLMKNGHQVMVYDRYLKSLILKDTDVLNNDFKSAINSFSPDMVGFSTVTPAIYDTVAIVGYLRTFYKGIVIAGGHHATAIPAETLEKIPGIDYIIAGEGEVSLPLLAGGVSPSDIPGVYTMDTDPCSFKPSRIPVLDNLPMPEYGVFDMDYYTSPNIHTIRGFYKKTADILTSRGCNNNCSFCSETLTYGRGVRYHSSDYVIENIEKLLADYDVNALYFHDNDFLISRDHAESICKKMISKKLNTKIEWCVQAGTSRIDDEILSLMAKAGCVKIEFGMESVRDEHLKSLEKKRTIDMNEKVIKLCNSHGIRIHSYFMTGFPEETPADMEALIRWVKRHKPHTFQLSQTKLYPGTRLYNEKGNSFFEKNDWTRENIENFFKTDHLSPVDSTFRKNWYRQKYRPFYNYYHRKTLLKSNSIKNLFNIIRTKLKS